MHVLKAVHTHQTHVRVHPINVHEALYSPQLHTVDGSYSNMDQPNETHPQNSDSATANTGTSESHTEVRIHNASHGQLSSTATPTDSAATSDVMQGNTFFQNAQSVNISGTPHFVNIGGIWRSGLESLERFVSFDAQFDSSAQDPERICHPGTRQNVLKRLGDWIDNPSAKERIFWLYGPAGAGKSAIAQTIAHSYARPKVAATFFFFKTDPNRNDGNRLFTTLAYQLAFSMPKIRDHIAHALSERPDLPRTSVETQFNQLLSRPFQLLTEDTAQQSAPTVGVIGEMPKKYQELAPVIVIDGVDECADAKLQQRFLKVIGDAVADDSFPVRFLIVSRPEVHIEQTIRRFQTPILTIDLADLDIPDESYLETLNRVPDQDFLKTFLGLLVGRCSIISRDSLSKDDAMLMDISRDELGERLHEMHSILRFEPFIDVHHRSFLKFLQDSSRSGQYHVDRSAGTRRYLELITKLLIRHARLTNHGTDHFAPEFGKLIKRNPQTIKLDIEDWEQALRPLLNALDKLLVPSNIDSLMDGYCQQCQFFQIAYDTLTHFKSLRNSEDPVVEKCLKSLKEIILYGNPRHQNFDTNFRPVVFGSAAIAGILMAILAHQR